MALRGRQWPRPCQPARSSDVIVHEGDGRDGKRGQVEDSVMVTSWLKWIISSKSNGTVLSSRLYQ